MGVVSMLIGIVSAVLGFCPLFSWLAVFPASVGLILGMVDVKRKFKPGQKKWQGRAGIIINAAAIVIILLWSMFFATAVCEEIFDFSSSFK